MTVFPAGHILTSADFDTLFPTGSGAWASFTPTWSGTLGNGTLTCSYVKVNRLVVARYSLTWGTTTSHAAAAQTFTLPVAAAAAAHGLGPFRCFDTSASGTFIRTAYMNTTNQIAFVSEAGAFITNTVPMTWATGDFIAGTITYESAS